MCILDKDNKATTYSKGVDIVVLYRRKLKQRIADLYRLRYREAQPIKSFAFLEDKEGAVGRHPLSMRAGARSHSETAGRMG